MKALRCFLVILLAAALPASAATVPPDTRVLIRRAAISWIPPMDWEAHTPQELGITPMQLQVNMNECYPRFSGRGVDVSIEVEAPRPGETIDHYANRRNQMATESQFLHLSVNRQVTVAGMPGYRAIIAFNSPVDHGNVAYRLLRYYFPNPRGEFVTVTAKVPHDPAMKHFATAFENTVRVHFLSR